ncbi:protein-L-histidine N-pros-methyltransferase [Lampetra fluviatilis]
MRVLAPLLSICFFALLWLRIMWTGRYLRKPLTRSLYMSAMGRVGLTGNHGDEDEEMAGTRSKYGEWYTVNQSRLREDLHALLQENELDESTRAFLANSTTKSGWLFTQLYYSMVSSLLGFFVSRTSVNGVLGRGSMFVLSAEQFRRLLGIPESWRADSLLDLGAGDGEVTAIMGAHFNQVFVTEVSPTMQWRLRKRNFTVLGVTEWNTVYDRPYDLVSCLNLLDRCERPLTLLREVRQVLRPGSGRLLLAVVLPYRPYVERGGRWEQPSECVSVHGDSWEEQLNSLVIDVLQPNGFQVESFTRVPYLCEGDLYNDHYVLDDAVLLLKPV